MKVEIEGGELDLDKVAFFIDDEGDLNQFVEGGGFSSLLFIYRDVSDDPRI